MGFENIPKHVKAKSYKMLLCNGAAMKRGVLGLFEVLSPTDTEYLYLCISVSSLSLHANAHNLCVRASAYVHVFSTHIFIHVCVGVCHCSRHLLLTPTHKHTHT